MNALSFQTTRSVLYEIGATGKIGQIMADRGYKKIAFLGGNESISDYHQRLSGYTEAMTLAEIPFSKKLCVQSDTTRNGGRSAMSEALIQSPDLQAVVCFSDVVAYGAIEQIRATGKQPGSDIAVIGFDDLIVGRACRPQLTTMHYPVEEMASYATNLAIKLSDIGNKPNSQTHLFLANLVKRDSVNKLVNAN